LETAPLPLCKENNEKDIYFGRAVLQPLPTRAAGGKSKKLLQSPQGRSSNARGRTQFAPTGKSNIVEKKGEGPHFLREYLWKSEVLSHTGIEKVAGASPISSSIKFFEGGRGTFFSKKFPSFP